MARTNSNELARSGHTQLGEHGVKNKVDESRPLGHESFGPVPEDNQPGHQPEQMQDKPLDKFAALAARERRSKRTKTFTPVFAGAGATAVAALVGWRVVRRFRRR